VRILNVVLVVMVWGLGGCGSGEVKSTPPEAGKPKAAARPKPVDHARLLPQQGQVDSTLVEDHLFGKDFLPGGNVAQYKQGKKAYELFVIQAADAQAAANLLFEFKTKLESAKVEAGFGGYSGKDGGIDTFLFTKGSRLAGVRGVPRDEAYEIARLFAPRL
jgi:hypothetical protein